MPIVIKELFPSDPLSEALEKINFNFDQLIIAGGGPPGPIGPQGVPGIPGPQGERGDHWQVGITAPTSDHGPNFGSLKDYDFWISATGQVYYWDAGASAWTSSGTNLTGPQGASGATGGSFEMGMYQGSTGNALTPQSNPAVGPTNYTPGIGGATTVASGGVDFIIPVNIEKNSFFLGDSGWAYQKLNNFGVYDATQISNIQRLTPKQVIIQTGIDSTGLGGLTIGAYGATSTLGSTQSNYLGDPTAITDALNFFTAGFAFKQVGLNYAHLFRMRTGTIDLEIQAGDDNFLPLSAGKTPDLILRSNRTLISDWQSTPRATFNVDSTILREKLAIGYVTLPTFDVISGATSVLDVSNHARVRGNLLIGDLSGNASNVLIGYARTIDGSANIELFTNGSTPTTSTFGIGKGAGANGVAVISNTGTGQLIIGSSTPGSFINLATNNVNGSIRFSNSIGGEIARIDTVNQRVGILTNNPQEALHVNGNIHVSGGDRTIFNRDAFYLAFGTNNTEWMRITSGGLIGIGITTPTDKLEVGDGNISINDTILASQGIGRGIKFENGTTVASSINLYRGSAANNVGLSFINANAGATSEAMRIHPNGFISIGPSAHQTTPEYRVHIQGDEVTSLLIRSRNTSIGTQNNLLFQRSNLGSATPANYVLGGLSFGGYDGSGWSTGINGGSQILSYSSSTWTISSKPSDLRFLTTPNSGTSALERMRINQDGKIFIGSQGSITPQFDVTLQGTSDKSIGLANSGSPIPNDLIIQAGSGSTAVDTQGGILKLNGGQSRGAASSEVHIYTADASSTLSTNDLRPISTNPTVRVVGNLVSIFGVGRNPYSVLDVNGSITIYQAQGTDNQVRSQGLRFNLSGQTTTGYFSSIRPFEGNASQDRIGLSFLTSDNAVGTERMRINPDGGVQVLHDVLDNLGSFAFNATATPTSITDPGDIAGITIASAEHDRIIYFTRINDFGNGQILNGSVELNIKIGGSIIWYTYLCGGFTGAGIPINARKMWPNASYNFILPAGQSATINYKRTGLETSAVNQIQYSASSYRFGKQ